MKLRDIPRFPHIHYSIDVSLDGLVSQLKSFRNSCDVLDMDPDFQRGYVWTVPQQISYVEYMLRNPQSGKDIYFNHPEFMKSFKGTMTLLDGKQRIEAILMFLNGKIPAYGGLIHEYEPVRPGSDARIPWDLGFKFNVMRIPTRVEMIDWYLAYNSGGTYHTAKEIERVIELRKEAAKNGNV